MGAPCRGDKHVRHTGSFRRNNSSGTVLKNNTITGRHAEQPGSLQKGIGGRFPVDIVSGADHCIEQLRDTKRVKGGIHQLMVASRRDRQWGSAMDAPGKIQDRLDRRNLSDKCQVEALFPPDRFFNVQTKPEHLVQFRDDNIGGLSAPGIKQILREFSAEFLHGPGPCTIVKGHRVGDRSVAIENISAEPAGRKSNVHVAEK